MKKLALVFAAALALTACTAAPTETATVPAADPPAEAAATEENADAEQFPVGERGCVMTGGVTRTQPITRCMATWTRPSLQG